ncbi:ead/Ea22-like family protein [Salmonella enterica]|nr:ead/Ea22-like family protein [Salmonella enterica]EEA6006433.1 ead/Ea22-like family protein [Salmonella enterica subsp. diarizonae]EEO4706279.1 ead/Ea22-like family protein [Salmonella enterica]EFT1602274.1 ead/Ea22-like family protein [Salmonella enterica]EGU3667583.1 ead/Ea22-like family protein [Salmonella enterica]
MTIDKQALREAAEKATPGNWRRASSRFNGITVTLFSLCGEEVTLAHTVEKRDAEFIAAANPATVLALLAELEATHRQVGELTMWVKRLAYSLRNSRPRNKLHGAAMDYLSHKGLISVEDVLR